MDLADSSKKSNRLGRGYRVARRLVCACLILFASRTLFAQQTKTQYLSGHGKDDVVPWNFFCTSGAQSGYWTNLPVPSNWELHGFGQINYHRDHTNSYGERGLYEREFSVPSDWKGGKVFLVFDGSMTDTSASVNGTSAGAAHQGAYYRFKYDITGLVKFGTSNKLEVTVAKHSTNTSVNDAERTGDYWMYGGIFRPVYLELVPVTFIDRVAIDAKADGSLTAQVHLEGVTNAAKVQAQIQTLDGKNFGPQFEVVVSNNATVVNLKTQVKGPHLWTAETPNLYQLKLRLVQTRKIVHEYENKFGFRTFEVRDGNGLYLNGKRIVLKGCNRHSFWPDSGRCLSTAVHRLDIETMKDMNMNAVRMSHYPPDAEFLDLCDELGLYVLDELAGWHKHYDTSTGEKLVQEMVSRDVNHPSILFWDNGNEGGFNTNLDNLFGAMDPQQRRVLHPWAPFNGMNTAHYLPYSFALLACEGAPITFHKNNYLVDTNSPWNLIYMPTEFLHGLYDGGAGAGMADIWELMERSRFLGGGFIWAFLDEGIKRADNGTIDVSGNEAPDGIVGPYREREASFYAIKQIWSPVVIVETNLPPRLGDKLALTVKNNYAFTDTRQCRFSWQLRKSAGPYSRGSSEDTIIARGKVESPGILPGETDGLQLRLPENFWHTVEAGDGAALAVKVEDPGGRELWTYVWPLPHKKLLRDDAPVAGRADYVSGTNGEVIELKAGRMVVKIQDGFLSEVACEGRKISLGNGPRAASTNVQIKSISWKLRADSWLVCDYAYTASGTNDFLGVLFDYPENLVQGKRWFGEGPYRVWKNRLQGVTAGLWQNRYNNTITGWRDWAYPEFKGCFAHVVWLQLDTKEGRITLANEGATPYVQVLTPEFPPANLAGHTIPHLPECGLGMMDAIPPMGSKFQAAEAVSPSGERAMGKGDYSGSVGFYFGDLP